MEGRHNHEAVVRHTVLEEVLEGVLHTGPVVAVDTVQGVGRNRVVVHHIGQAVVVDTVQEEDHNQAVGRRIDLGEGRHTGLEAARHSGREVAADRNLAAAGSRRTVDSALVPGSFGAAVAVRSLGVEGVLWGISTNTW